ncbi:carbohydrate kinase family protein [Clostridium estertheticum]|uniref:carbohydrate kinase family protein n=1 Tax=Clostridium estertheticum TaxID=238834 RepID=UPI001C0E56D1|nr:carbohydrate kinase family protein [Clostridium estertheticum]MBU3200481.1 carbohydrate kinase family protein [Clostridium estertheticum]WAG66722.1 carbohydrate kinase family protein [Clostridium estertheticum]
MISFNKKIEFNDNEIDVLAIGELLIDMISKEYSNNFESNDYQRYFGGSPANIAMNTTKLGIKSQIVSAVGNDGLGEFLIQHLKNNNINTGMVKQVDYPTSIVLITKSIGTPVPIFYRNADFQVKYNEELEEKIKKSKIVHFSCWPLSMQPFRNTIEQIIKIAQKNKIIISFDPNYHPMIWERGHDGIEYVKSIIKYVDIIKPSEDDAQRLFGKDTIDNQIDKFLKLGAKLVIMTIGKDGAIVSNGSEKIKIPTLASNVVDTTGAGDAFWSGFYAAIIKGYTVKQALYLAAAVSAFKLKFLGAVVELPSIEEIKNIYKL